MRFTLFIALILIPGLIFASPAEEPEEVSIPILETTQELFGTQVNTVANRLDLFFADQRADDELARSRIRIRHRYEIRERELLNRDTEIRINIRLPKLEDKFKFEMESDEVKKDETKTEKKIRKMDEASTNELNKRWQFRADLGVNASIPPRVFSRARLRKNMETGTVIHRFVEELAWYSDRDWEENTTLDSDQSIKDNLLFRFRNATDWKVTRKDFKTQHGPSLLHKISLNDAFSYNANFTTTVEPGGIWFVNNYRLSVNYRRNLYKQWLFMDIIPGIDFPKKWSFRRTPFAVLQIEALFGGY